MSHPSVVLTTVAHTVRGKLLAGGALLLSAVALAACGESKQEKAKAEVCAARGEINKQVTKLQGLTLSTNVANEVKGSLEVIGKELEKIKNAQPDLEPARKEQVEAATKTFEQQLTTVASGVVSSLSTTSIESALSSAGPKLKSALNTLATDYKQALGPISC
jgi:hypothetical protein